MKNDKSHQQDALKSVVDLIAKKGPGLYQTIANVQVSARKYDDRIVRELYQQINESISTYNQRCPEELKKAINEYVESYPV